MRRYTRPPLEPAKPGKGSGVFQRVSETDGSVKNKVKYTTRVRAEGGARGRRVEADTLPPRLSPLFMYLALFFTLTFQGVVGMPYSIPIKKKIGLRNRGQSN